MKKKIEKLLQKYKATSQLAYENADYETLSLLGEVIKDLKTLLSLYEREQKRKSDF